MTDDPDDSKKHIADVARRYDHIARVTQNCGPEVVKAMNDSVPFLEDFFLGEGVVADVPYVPHYKSGNQWYTGKSTDPEVVSVIRRCALNLARLAALHVPSLAQARQSSEDSLFLVNKRAALAKAFGPAPFQRNAPPKLARSMTEARLADLAVKAAEGFLDTSRIKVEPRPGSLKKLRSFLIRFPTRGDLLVLVAIEFEGLSLWSSAVALTHPAKKPLPLLLFMDVSPASDYAWPTDMPTETRIACSLRVIAAFAAQIK